MDRFFEIIREADVAIHKATLAGELPTVVWPLWLQESSVTIQKIIDIRREGK
jgi:hypothetical protein